MIKKKGNIKTGDVFREIDSRFPDRRIVVVGVATGRKEPSKLCMNEYGNITKISDRNLIGRFRYLGRIAEITYK